MKYPASIRGRFLLVSVLTVGLALALSTVFFVSLFSSNISKRIDAELTSHINMLAGALAFDSQAQVIRPTAPLDRRFSEPYSGLYWQIVDDARGQVLRSTSLWDMALDLPQDVHTDGAIHHYTLPGPESSNLLVQERLVIAAAPDGPRRLRIAVAIDQKVLNDARSGFARDILPAIAGLGVFLIGASIAQLTFGLKALGSLSDGITRIREHRERRLTGPFPSEFKSTVNAVNQLLETQELMIAKARSRAADLAHGLRTPLTILSNDALTLREKGETEIADELDHLTTVMRDHVERELALSRIAARADLRSADAQVGKVIAELIRILRRTPAGENLHFRIDGADDTLIAVDPGDFRELAGNLLENAVKWARTEICVRWERQPQQVRLTIADDGPGAPEMELAKLTQRGRRLDNAKPGSGLGLSIVREIVDVYGIGFELRNRKAQGGLEARLVFPIKDQAGHPDHQSSA